MDSRDLTDRQVRHLLADVGWMLHYLNASSEAAVDAASVELLTRMDRAGIAWEPAIEAVSGKGEPPPEERERIEAEDEQYHRDLTLQREAESDQFPRLA